MACALGAAPKATTNASYKDDVKPHAGGAFLIMGWMGSIALAGLSFVALGEGGEELGLHDHRHLRELALAHDLEVVLLWKSAKRVTDGGRSALRK